MTWAEFKTAVRVYLTVDSNRLNTQDFVDRSILSGVIDIQSYIPYYRVHGSVTYSLNGTIKDTEPLAVDESASSGALEGDMRITDAYFVDGKEDYDWQDDLSEAADSNSECFRFPLTVWAWANRHDLLCGAAEGHHAISIHPNGVNFIVYPQVTSTDKIEIFFQNIDRTFSDTDQVPFGDEEVVQAVAEYVKSKLAREVDRDIQMHMSYLSSYEKLRQRIYLDARDRKKVAYSNVSPLSDNAVNHKNKGCDTSGSIITTLTSSSC